MRTARTLDLDYFAHYGEGMKIGDKKKKLVEEILKSHPRAKDMHAKIYPNAGAYKDDFMNIYNHKCAYCGVSIEVISRTDFEVDHYIYEKSKNV